MLLAFVVLFGIVSSIVWFIHKEITAPTKPFEEISITPPTIKADFPQKYDQPLIIKLTDLAISILPLKANPAQAETKDNTVSYIDAYENTDIVQTKSAGKLKEDIILKTPNHPEQFQYQIDLSQYDFSQDKAGNLFFYDKGKKGNGDYLRFEIPAPFMIDADKKISSTADVEFNLSAQGGPGGAGNGLLTLKPKKDWLKNAKYPITLDPTIEITILNVHSHPAQGDNWIIDFNTQGTADLKIIPNDQATIDDDQFYSLKCGDEPRTPKILKDNVISFQDWNCNTTGQVIFYTKKAGNHTMKFQFGTETSYAFNNALPFYATGGTVTYDGGYEIHTFTATGSDTLQVTGSGLVDYFMVGGGAGGSGYAGGGGGRVATGLSVPFSSGSWTITVGGGGPVYTAGGASSIVKGGTTYSVVGGSGSGDGLAGGNGGSGGGAYGNSNGGNGGSHGSNGFAGVPEGYVGGSGLDTGNATYEFGDPTKTAYAGGGGGGSHLGTPGTGGAGGGGNGGRKGIGPATSGSVNTGGGGGGYWTDDANYYGGSGGSGIVIVRLIPVWPPPPVFYAVGGTVTRVGSYEIHTFTNVGTTSIAFTGSGTVNYLVVGGGGGGGSETATGSSSTGGGGGAGGMLAGTLSVTAGSKSITIGNGGTGGVQRSSAPTNGGNSSIGTDVIALGGGRAGNDLVQAASGGSGGGSRASGSIGSGTVGPPRQGYDGGSGYNNYPNAASGGGGGGASAVGTNGSSSAGGSGGAGATSSISGASVTYAGGGGGGGNSSVGSSSGGAGGAGGGGAGCVTGTCTAGTANTGGGGGGGGSSSGAGSTGGSGGSGIVIISFIPTLPPEIVFRSAYAPPTDQYTKLLLHTDGTNGSTTFTDSETIPKTVTANGNAQISTAQSKFNGSSGYFDGTGDYLSVPDSDDFAFGSGDFTIDFWVKRNSINTEVMFMHQYQNNQNEFRCTSNASNNLYFYQYAGGYQFYYYSANGVLADTNWHHVAFTRSGNTGYIFLDGVSLSLTAHAAFSGSLSNIPGTFYVGASFYGETGIPSTVLNGYIDEFRVSKGIARWTSNFTPPTSAYSSTAVSGLPTIFRTAATDQYTRLLLHSDGSGSTFVDSESRPKTITANGDATQSAVQSKFGGKSAYFDGTGDYLFIPDSDDWNFGSGDFTIDFWVNPGQVSAQKAIFSQEESDYYPANFAEILSGQIRWVMRTASGADIFDMSSSSTLAIGTWYHVALVKNGTTYKIYINGTERGSATNSTVMENVVSPFEIGRRFDGACGLPSCHWNGYIDELRVSKGIARWTSNFTPPTSAYTSTGSDVILK